ncbi:hypothetical protein F1B92_03675 [Campylobacter sp. FMV-PI01]|uniref:Plasminogen-binding protein PgbA N-terminal domain-containing protein n=1 Tax=Campylobacter portucalensis TaxID=2608384 RepID=A0A6L5WGZ0_9BACT|nr:plasminogen-binding N-terminal domain-containing protein [Campylobacter portucalensis]MSN96299.1 hypothetical protein [Campylobacter portucalensis]
MRHILVFLSIFLVTLSASSSFNPKTYETPLINVNDGEGEIIDSANIVLGSSGVVTHSFKNGESSIIARAVVTQKNGTTAKVRFEVFGMLSQPALPVPGILPKVGDKVILNFLYDRALIVVPNKEIYDQVVKFFPHITFIEPDIMGAFLSMNNKPNPNRDDFRELCALNSAGLIFIAMDKEAVFADCGSFEILKKFQSGEVSYYQTPFYSNIKEISTVFWKFDSAYIKDYNEHYRYLLDLE